MKYEQKLKNEFVAALKMAFPLPDDMENMADAAGLTPQWVNIKEGVSQQETAIRRLINWCASNYCLIDLLEAAAARSQRDELQRVVAHLRPLQDPLREVGSELGSVEKVLFHDTAFQDVGQWLIDLTRIRRAVCRVEPQPESKSKHGWGTGFLIAPDLVITNWHVAEPFWEDRKLPAKQVVLRFGCENDANGKPSNGEEFGIKPDWQLPHSQVEECDFALLRLDRSATTNDGGQERQALTFADKHDIESAEALLILQHPGGKPLQLALGSVETRSAEESKRPQNFWYKVNTMGGSSGAPCLTQDLAVVGLHHYGEQIKNRGVRASAILPKIKDWLAGRQSRPEALTGTPDIPGQEKGEPAPTDDTVNAGSVDRLEHTSLIEKRAFIVQAVGKEGSDTRIRADRVRTQLIEPACRAAGFEPVLAHLLSTGTITEPIISELFTDQLVIADLGTPPWNSNVMIEVGFRLSTARPIALLVDKQVSQEDLPLHLQNLRFVPIDPDNPRGAQDALVARMRSCKREATSQAWMSQYAYVDFRLSLTDSSKSVYLYANAQAAHIYGYERVEDIVGMPVDDVDKHVSQYMSKEHLDHLSRDQKILMGAILGSLAKGTIPDVSARVPLWFAEHEFDDQVGKLYLPVISHYKYHAPDQSVIMRVVYLDVSDWSAGEISSRVPQDVRVPAVFRRPRRHFEDDVFLPYDSTSATYGRAIRQLLDSFDLNVCIAPDGAENTSDGDLIQGMRKSRMIVLLVSSDGLGQWQERPQVREALLRYCRDGNPFMLLLHPDVQSRGRDPWKAYVPDAYVDVFAECLYLPMSSLGELRPRAPEEQPTFLERIFRELVKMLRRLGERE